MLMRISNYLKYITLAGLLAGYLYLGLTPSQPLVEAQGNQKMGLLVVATGGYVNFIPPLVDSAKKFFLAGHDVTFFIFTDHPELLPHDRCIVPIKHERRGWPYDSMMRSEIYYKHRDQFSSMDYLFACDADMIFVDFVGDEILAPLIATRHPGYLFKRGLFENNPASAAYVGPHEGAVYLAGGFYGGQKDNFIDFIDKLTCSIQKDLDNGIMPRWHDESHLNRYFIDHAPAKVLSPSYCYPEGWSLSFHPRLVALNKNRFCLRS